MSTATLSGHRVTRARVQLPAWGCWWCECEIDEEIQLSGRVELKLADLVLVGTVVAGGPSKGSSRYRIAAGAASWGTTIPAKDYAADAGVKLRTVVADAAKAAGETLALDSVPTTSIGSKWTRFEGPASRVLELAASEAWYVGEDGVTRLGRRARVDFTAQATRGEHDVSRGTLELQAEQIATLVPGVVVDGVEATDVQHDLDATRLRTTIWAKAFTQNDRMLAAYSKLIEQLLPDYPYRGVFEFRVVTQEGERLNLQPVRASLGLPSLRRVRVRPGLPGCHATVTPGTVVLVQFVNADPARAVVTSFEDAEGPAFMPIFLDLGDGPTLGVARMTDPVQAGPFSGVVVGGSFHVRAGL
jgi:hypothetical protein